jgi:predicted DNA-binding protein (MmcQ/YjbR family)
MAATKKDPTEAMRLKAGLYPDVDKGTACTQSSFKTGGKAFLFVGTQGGRFKAMFKLKQSLGEAEKLSEKEPENFDVGSTQWVTARFTAEKPMPQKLWKKWLDESYELSCKPPKAKVSKKKGKS